MSLVLSLVADFLLCEAVFVIIKSVNDTDSPDIHRLSSTRGNIEAAILSIAC
jgi:hypothetical protein